MASRVGLFGGTFDPIHLGHLILAEQCRERAALDEVWFLPAAIPPHKPSVGIASFEDRAKMVELAIEGNPFFRLDVIERERSGPSFTYDTLVELHRRHPGMDFLFIMGADSIAELPDWHRPHDILSLCALCLVNRPGFPMADIAELARRLGMSAADISHVIVPTLQIDISSRDIRTRCRQRESLRYLVTDAVREWIQLRKIYSK